MLERVLICTDLQDGLQRLIGYGDSLSAGGLKQAIFLHTVPLLERGIISRVDTETITQIQAQLETQLKQAVGATTPSLDVKIEVVSGRPAATILKTVQSYQAELVVLGSQVHSLLAEKLIGSTMAELSHCTPVPLLVLRPQLIRTFTAEELTLRCRHLLQSVLLPYDGSASANYLVQQIKALAQKQSGIVVERCVLCRVANDLEQTPAHDILGRLKADLEAVGLRVEIAVREGTAISQILETAQQADVSAIAVSSGTIGKFQEWLVSSCTAEILRQSWHPVLFFPR
jgi:nucleotide-binding universal stress UspA family protein